MIMMKYQADPRWCITCELGLNVSLMLCPHVEIDTIEAQTVKNRIRADGIRKLKSEQCRRAERDRYDSIERETIRWTSNGDVDNL
jgi:hypothetical protein